MTVRSLRPVLFGAIAALALLAAGACGGDDDTTTEAGGSAPSDASGDDIEDAASDAIADELGSGCRFLGEFADTGFAENFDPSGAFAEGGEIDFGALYGPLSEQFREVADAAPSEIADAFSTMADAFESIADEVEGVKLDFSDPANIDPEAMATFEKLGEVFDNAEFEAASDEIEVWLEENCDLSAG